MVAKLLVSGGGIDENPSSRLLANRSFCLFRYYGRDSKQVSAVRLGGLSGVGWSLAVAPGAHSRK